MCQHIEVSRQTEEFLDEQIKKLDRIEGKFPFTNKEKRNKNIISLPRTYNRTIPIISKILNRNWIILQINIEFYGVFQTKSMVAFKLSKNLQEVILSSKELFLRKVCIDKTENLCLVV